MFLHGGMWLLGDLDTHDRTCRRLARGAGVAVLAVDYRRAPEHPWPAAVEDAVRALRWAAGLGGTGVAVAGDSSGGNLAALACVHLRDAGEPPPTAQVLICPNTDLTLGRPSVRAKGHGWGLDVDDLAWAVGLWVRPPRTPADPRVSPLLALDLSGLPPAVVVTAEHDPLRDEGDAFAARLAAAGVAVRHRCEAGLVHGFIQGLDCVSPVAAAAAERLFADVRAVLSPPRRATRSPSWRPCGSRSGAAARPRRRMKRWALPAGAITMSPGRAARRAPSSWKSAPPASITKSSG